MHVSYDIATGAFSIDTASPAPFGDFIEARLIRHGQVVSFDNLQFGIHVTRDGGAPVTQVFPPAGVVYRQTDQDRLTVWRADWQPDEVVEISVWMENGGTRIEDAATFTVPRPARPYPSWSWGGTAWTAPQPYPTDGGDYDWDEPSLSWQPEIS